jgi:NAD(P)-dependent dehydrogenase (short-subunit alcohol dehydrogenase family)
MAEKQRSVLVTGAARGIGRAVVELFAGAGWHVIGLDRDQYEGQFPAPGLLIRADVASASELEEAFVQVSKSAESLDALVNNAALQIAKPILETTPEEWDRLMDVNLRAAFLVIKHAHPLLKKASGAIVNLSSVHAVATSADIAAYAASKGGLLAFTRALAIEFAPDNIRVNAVLPGAVDTPMLRAGLSRGHLQGALLEERLADLASKTVIGRVGSPEEIARAVYFLADDEQSSFITGQSLIVDGGASARLSTE